MSFCDVAKESAVYAQAIMDRDREIVLLREQLRRRGGILDAPCIFCGYSGDGYFQSRTHEKDCPWHLVTGASQRESLLPSYLLYLRNRVGELKEAVQLGVQVMNLLQAHGGAVVPHLLDTDENVGERFREAVRNLNL